MPKKSPIDHSFNQPELLESALTHPSCAEAVANYQRLEFLGDSVLGLVIAEELFQKYPDAGEGTLDRMRATLVNGKALTQIARELELDQSLRVGEAHRQHQSEPSAAMLEDALEAVIGAIYLDAGFESVRAWILRQFASGLNSVAESAERGNPKGRLQERIQEAEGHRMPEYRLLASEGPDHAKSYTVAVYLGDQKLSEGSGSSKKSAEIAAAEAALSQLFSQN